MAPILIVASTLGVGFLIPPATWADLAVSRISVVDQYTEEIPGPGGGSHGENAGGTKAGSGEQSASGESSVSSPVVLEASGRPLDRGGKDEGANTGRNRSEAGNPRAEVEPRDPVQDASAFGDSAEGMGFAFPAALFVGFLASLGIAAAGRSNRVDGTGTSPG